MDPEWLSPEMYSPRDSFQLYEIVEVDVLDDGNYQEAMVRVVHEDQDGAYTVELLDTAEVFTYIPLERINMLVKYSKGMQIEVSVCEWDSAEVIDLTPTGKYVVTFDETGLNQNVVFEDLRPQVKWRPKIACWVIADGVPNSLVIAYHSDSDEYSVVVNNVPVRLGLDQIQEDQNRPCR